MAEATAFENAATARVWSEEISLCSTLNKKVPGISAVIDGEPRGGESLC